METNRPPVLRRIKSRILIPVTAAILTIGVITTALTVEFVSSQTRRELNTEVETITRMLIDSTLRDIDENGHSAEIGESLGHLTWNGEAKVVDIVGMDGVVKYSVFNGNNGKKAAVCGTCHMSRGTKPPMRSVRHVYGGALNLGISAYTIIPVNKSCVKCHGEKTPHLGVIRMEVEIAEHNEFLRNMLKNAAVAGALAIVLITCITSIVLSHTVTNPITDMLDAFSRIGKGDFTRPLLVKSRGEIGMLTAAAEKMRGRLAKREEELQQRDTHIVELDSLRSNLEKANSSLRHIVSELSLLNNIGATANSTLDLDELFEKLDGVIRETLDLENISLFLYNDKLQELELRAATGLPPEATARATIKPGEGLIGNVFKSADPLIIQDARARVDFDPHAGLHPDTRSLVCVPLTVRMCNIGVMCITSRKPGAFSPEELPFYGAVANQLAIAIDNARMYEVQKELATMDSLTGLLNHGALQTRLNEEVSRCLRYPRPLALIMLDLDRFKLVNDTFGHQTGDKVLVEVSRIIREQTREVDVCARYGGEEFAIMLPETDMPGAMYVAERIRAAAESGDYCLGVCTERVSATISAGVSVFRGAGDSAGCLIERADKALYRAKENGRNRVETSTGDGVPENGCNNNL